MGIVVVTGVMGRGTYLRQFRDTPTIKNGVGAAEYEIMATPTTATSASHALVVTADPTPRNLCLLFRPTAPYLAQLIATKQGLPQTRRRCRATSYDAIDAYKMQATAAARLCHHSLSRDL
jgi:hypothetical protein